MALQVAGEHVRQGHDVSMLLLEDNISLPIPPSIAVSALHKSSLFKRNPLWAVYWALCKTVLGPLIPDSEFIWSAPLYRRLYQQRLAGLEQDGPFDIVFMHSFRVMRNLHTVPHRRCLYILHGAPNWLSQPRGWLASKYFMWLHRLVFTGKDVGFVSRELEKDFLGQTQRAGTKISSHHVINNPCDIDTIRRMANEPIEFDEEFILSVGRLASQKRYDILLRAYSKVDTTLKLVLIGSGRQQEELQKLTRKLGIADRVIFYGTDQNPFRWMANARMFVLSSDFEGFPMVLIEAVSCGTPIVATRCQGVSTILAGELARGIVSIGDVDALAAKITEYLDRPVKPAAGESLRFSIRRCADQYLAALADDSV